MDAKVLKDFSCRLRGMVYRPGDVYEGTAERIAELAKGGYVQGAKPAAKPKSTTTTKRRTTRKTATKE